MVTVEQVRDALRAVKDPELNINVVDLGLVYEIEIGDGGTVHVEMTLTSPGCPAGPEMLTEAQGVLAGLDGVSKADVELVWEPYWTPEKMDPRVRSLLWG
ncbi:MAG TPA: metal-sulfur cluster assembly factor [Gemmatimonadales bacterium]|nr:metal-sulfur cluster assembly factor [Gemmatimonadales bacterium]